MAGPFRSECSAGAGRFGDQGQFYYMELNTNVQRLLEGQQRLELLLGMLARRDVRASVVSLSPKVGEGHCKLSGGMSLRSDSNTGGIGLSRVSGEDDRQPARRKPGRRHTINSSVLLSSKLGEGGGQGESSKDVDRRQTSSMSVGVLPPAKAGGKKSIPLGSSVYASSQGSRKSNADVDHEAVDYQSETQSDARFAAQWRSEASMMVPQASRVCNSSAGSGQTLQARQELHGSWEGLELVCEQLLVTIAEGADEEVMAGVRSVELGTGSIASLGSYPRDRRAVASVLAPTSKRRMLIDVVLMVMLVYDLWSLPYIVAFSVPPEGYLIHLNVVSVVCWTVDMLATFRTGFYEHGELIMAPRQIRRHYLSTTFAFDLVLVAVDAMALAMSLTHLSGASAPDAMKIGRMVKITRLLRCMSVLRVRRISEAVDRFALGNFAHATTTVLVDVAKFTTVILWLNHIIACVWVFLGRFGYSDTGMTWLDMPTGLSSDIGIYRDADDVYQYTTAMHWALTQMTPGSMPVVPMNSVERTFNLACLIFGMVGFSTLISSISSTVTQFKLNMTSRTAKMQALNRFLRSVSISSQLVMQVRKQVAEKLKYQRPLVVKDVELLNLISLSLRSSLDAELCQPHLQRHEFFHLLLESDHAVAKELCRSSANFSAIAKCEDLFLSGTEAKGMHFVTRGSMAYRLNGDSQHVDLAIPEHQELFAGTYDVVEAGRWLSEAALWVTWRHVGRAENISSDVSEVLTVCSQEFAQLLRRRGGVLAQLAWAYGQIFWLMTMDSEQGQHSLVGRRREGLDDLNLTFEIEAIFAAMPRQAKMVISHSTIRTLRSCQPSWVRRFDRSQLLHQLSPVEVDELEREASSGASTLLLAGSRSGVLRVARELSLHLTRADGRLLVLLPADRSAESSERPTWMLPAVDFVGSESVEEALQRLLDDQLSALAEGVKVVEVKVESVRDEPSRHGGVSTWRGHTTVYAHWVAEPRQQCEIDADVFAPAQPDAQRASSAPPQMVKDFVESIQNIQDLMWTEDSAAVTRSRSVCSCDCSHCAEAEEEDVMATKSWSEPRRPGSQLGRTPKLSSAPEVQRLTLPDGSVATWMAREEFRALGARGRLRSRSLSN